MGEAKEKQLDADDLKRIRKSLKLTQKDMAEKLEISRSMIAMIENKATAIPLALDGGLR